MERAAKIRAYLENELSVIREQIRSQWNLDDGLFLTETGDVNNTYVYDALDTESSDCKSNSKRERRPTKPSSTPRATKSLRDIAPRVAATDSWLNKYPN
ncbi:hypothetical protein PG984_002224 [Apiospora sp. TS-2023a]